MEDEKKKAKELMKWLIMWDKPDYLLKNNRIFPGDMDVEREVERIFSQNMNLTLPEYSLPKI
ncbi:MAG: hypothetical protein Kow0090_11410 [Myxococcota bacterium]